jgi:hypothetical protein
VPQNSVRISCSASSLLLVLGIRRKTEDEGRGRARGNHTFFGHALTDGSGKVTDRMEYSAYGTLTYRAGTNITPIL